MEDGVGGNTSKQIHSRRNVSLGITVTPCLERSVKMQMNSEKQCID